MFFVVESMWGRANHGAKLAATIVTTVLVLLNNFVLTNHSIVLSRDYEIVLESSNYHIVMNNKAFNCSLTCKLNL